MTRLLSIRRYPVKAMAGEDLDSAQLDARGIVGDRWFAVVDGEGHFAAGKDTRRFRRHDEVLDYAAATGATGVTVSGAGGSWAVGDPALDAELTRAMGLSVRVLPEADVPHQDGGGVSLVGSATLRWCARHWDLDADPRRLRVNLVVETDEPFVEESWVGREVTLGTATLRLVERIPRCRMLDVDQDGAVARGRWLKPLAAEREMCLGVYADVARPGTLAAGDELTLA